jgi:hypothetical protein
MPAKNYNAALSYGEFAAGDIKHENKINSEWLRSWRNRTLGLVAKPPNVEVLNLHTLCWKMDMNSTHSWTGAQGNG